MSTSELLEEVMKKSMYQISLYDLDALLHGAEYAASDKEYIKRFPIKSFQLVDIYDNISKGHKLTLKMIREHIEKEHPNAK